MGLLGSVLKGTAKLAGKGIAKGTKAAIKHRQNKKLISHASKEFGKHISSRSGADELKKLDELYEEGIISEREFKKCRKRVLDNF